LIKGKFRVMLNSGPVHQLSFELVVQPLGEYMKAVLASAAAIAALLSAGANAMIVDAEADCEASNGSATNGAVCGTADRRDLSNVEFSVLGDGDFFSLGLGGSATFEISPRFIGEGTAVEVTFGRTGDHVELADVLVSDDGINFQFVTQLSNAGNQRNFTFTLPGGPFSFIRFADATDTGSSSSFDGFDIDAFSVQTVPVPAAALLMPLGLAALARRKRRS
jgi:hypothetical protein